MTDQLASRCASLLTELGLMSGGTELLVTPLSGGVASDIARVIVTDRTSGAEQRYVVKFALPKLRVKADWFAPVTRNFAEYRWLDTVSALAPEASVRLFGHSPTQNGFVMACLEGDDTVLWKTSLLAGEGHTDQAACVGALLGRIHAHSTAPDFETDGFDNRDDFYALRLEPYLIHTSEHYPEHKETFRAVADQLYHADDVLIHGDVSPKNILFRTGRPHILDAECATFGDACFDVSFCLNHFILKAMHLPGNRQLYLSFCLTFWSAYQPFICWEAAAALEARLIRLLPMMMLARIDGKSPVEYLDKDTQNKIRQIALHLLAHPPETIQDFVQTTQRQALL